jgi:hypothetical protein
MQQTITDFVQDEEGYWVALLACGHRQHVRHRPPFVERPWVMTAEGRRGRIGAGLDCALCDQTRDPARILSRE